MKIETDLFFVTVIARSCKYSVRFVGRANSYGGSSEIMQRVAKGPFVSVKSAYRQVNPNF